MRKIVRVDHFYSYCITNFSLFFCFVELRMEDSVMIRNCPPVSALKRFTLEKIMRSPATERDIAHAMAVEPPTTPLTPIATS
jgi:hypothetical protein